MRAGCLSIPIFPAGRGFLQPRGADPPSDQPAGRQTELHPLTGGEGEGGTDTWNSGGKIRVGRLRRAGGSQWDEDGKLKRMERSQWDEESEKILVR